jgi:hypothetical protein
MIAFSQWGRRVMCLDSPNGAIAQVEMVDPTNPN